MRRRRRIREAKEEDKKVGGRGGRIAVRIRSFASSHSAWR